MTDTTNTEEFRIGTDYLNDALAEAGVEDITMTKTPFGQLHLDTELTGVETINRLISGMALLYGKLLQGGGAGAETTELQALIDKQREESFQPGADVSDEKVLGVLIARHLHWDSADILQTAIAALIDANFPDLAERLADQLTRVMRLDARERP